MVILFQIFPQSFCKRIRFFLLFQFFLQQCASSSSEFVTVYCVTELSLYHFLSSQNASPKLLYHLCIFFFGFFLRIDSFSSFAGASLFCGAEALSHKAASADYNARPKPLPPRATAAKSWLELRANFSTPGHLRHSRRGHCFSSAGNSSKAKFKLTLSALVISSCIRGSIARATVSFPVSIIPRISIRDCMNKTSATPHRFVVFINSLKSHCVEGFSYIWPMIYKEPRLKMCLVGFSAREHSALAWRTHRFSLLCAAR